MIIYLDIVFLENICMNYIILLATGYILKNRISYIRILLSSLLGSLYVMVIYITNFKTLLGIPMKILLSIAMIYISFGTTNIKKQIKEILVFYLTSFAFGGSAFAMIYFIKPQNIIMKNGVYIGTYVFNTILIGGILGFVLINIVFKIVKRRIKKEDMNCEIIIIFNKRSVKVNSMIDTGNMLKDPISKKNVAIVEKDIISKILPYEIINNLENILKGKIIESEPNVDKYMSSLKIIPFSSIGNDHGLILAFKPDEVYVKYDEQIEKKSNLLIGIYDRKLFVHNQYNAIVGLEILNKEEKINEFSENIKI